MSSFKKKISKSGTNNATEVIFDAGVKPWTNCGLGLVSSGHKQLDQILGGGIQLGTLSLLLTDHISNFGQSLLSYNISESISIGHRTLILAHSSASLQTVLAGLPANLYYDGSEANHAENDSTSELKIAASYQKYIGKIGSLQVLYFRGYQLYFRCQTSSTSSQRWKLSGAVKLCVEEDVLLQLRFRTKVPYRILSLHLYVVHHLHAFADFKQISFWQILPTHSRRLQQTQAAVKGRSRLCVSPPCSTATSLRYGSSYSCLTRAESRRPPVAPRWRECSSLTSPPC